MPNPKATTVRHAELDRTQRVAYFDWQNTPAGSGNAALDNYLAASDALEGFHRGLRK